MGIQTRMQKWGGSVSAPIPAAIARKLKLEVGSAIEVEEQDGAVVVRPLTRQKPKLADILKSCKKKFPRGNPHRETDAFGPPVGREAW